MSHQAVDQHTQADGATPIDAILGMELRQLLLAVRRAMRDPEAPMVHCGGPRLALCLTRAAPARVWYAQQHTTPGHRNRFEQEAPRRAANNGFLMIEPRRATPPRREGDTIQ